MQGFPITYILKVRPLPSIRFFVSTRLKSLVGAKQGKHTEMEMKLFSLGRFQYFGERIQRISIEGVESLSNNRTNICRTTIWQNEYLNLQES